MLKILPAEVPYIVQGFGGQFAINNSIVKSFFYDLSKQLLYTVLTDNQFNIFINVPPGVAKSFNYTKDADSFYEDKVNSFYQPVLLTEGCGPLLTEDGSYLVVR